MTNRDVSPFLRRLNDHCAQAVADAASLCEARAHRDIEIEHWPVKLFELGDCDPDAVLRRYELDVDSIWNGLLSAIERLPNNLRGKRSLSNRLRTLLKGVRTRESLDEQQPAIRFAHLLAAIVESPSMFRAADARVLNGVSAAQIEGVEPELDRVSIEAAVNVCEPVVSAQGELKRETRDVIPDSKLADHLGSEALRRFTIDVTQKARDGRIDRAFGWDFETREMVHILARHSKTKQVFVVEPRLGQSALVEGLALKIIGGEVADVIRGVSVLTLDLGLLQAGTGVREELKQRPKKVVEAAQQSRVPILLFIDAAHSMIGAGNLAGGADAANLLKPTPARGELHTIAATTWSEYKHYFKRNAALERRFHMVNVDGPDDKNACLALRSLREHYAQHLALYITDAAVAAAVGLSRRYLPVRQLPDKAVDGSAQQQCAYA